MAFLPYEKGTGRQVSMKRTIFLSVVIFALTFISLFAVQMFNDQERYWLRESERFHTLVIKISSGIAFCYSGNSNTTCFAVSPDGWYITAGHKVNKDFPESQKIYAKLERKREAEIFLVEKIIPPPLNQDLLLFKINHKPKFHFKDFAKPVMFEETWVMGFRGSSGMALSPSGYVTHDTSIPQLIRTSARTTFGQSGGPVINRKGQVVGVAILIDMPSFGDNFFIPSQQVKKYIEENLKK